MDNADVLKPYVVARDIVQQSSERWIVDFDELTEAEAERYLVPFTHVKEVVKPKRDTNRNKRIRKLWWRMRTNAADMRRAVKPLERFIVTPHVSKHRVFTWLQNPVIPSNLLIVVARDDDFTFGVLHSKVHEVWALKLGTSLEDRPRYTSSTCFETFPFPHASPTQKACVEKVG